MKKHKYLTTDCRYFQPIELYNLFRGYRFCVDGEELELGTILRNHYGMIPYTAKIGVSGHGFKEDGIPTFCFELDGESFDLPVVVAGVSDDDMLAVAEQLFAKLNHSYTQLEPVLSIRLDRIPNIGREDYYCYQSAWQLVPRHHLKALIDAKEPLEKWSTHVWVRLTHRYARESQNVLEVQNCVSVLGMSLWKKDLTITNYQTDFRAGQADSTHTGHTRLWNLPTVYS